MKSTHQVATWCVRLNLSKFFKHSGFKSALSTLILLIPLVLGVWANLDISYQLILISVTVILNIVFVYYDIKQPSWEIEDMLELMVKTLWGTNQAAHFRSNVMLYNTKRKKLSIKYSYNMMGHNDRKIALSTDQGCAGKAFHNESPFWVDLTTCTHESYLVDSKKIWKNMKSVMSVPIFEEEEVIGVLNIDSDLELNEAFMEGNEFNQNIINTANAYSDLVARWL